MLHYKMIILRVNFDTFKAPWNPIEESRIDEFKGLERVRTKFCTPHGTKTRFYGDFNSAINDCQSDDKCVGIYEEHCNGKGDFRLCEEVHKISNGVVSSACIYTIEKGKLRRQKFY